MNIDLIIVGIFLVITFATGLYYYRGSNTFVDYAIGNRNMPTWAISVSFMATMYGSHFLYMAFDSYYHEGLYEMFLDLVAPLLFYLTSRFITLRMKEFIGDLSIAESMGKVYGPVLRVITAILGIISIVLVVVLQLKNGVAIIATSPLFTTIGYPDYYMIVLGLFIIIYSTLGGARSIVWTDVYQFLFFSVCLPVISFMLIYHIQDPLINLKKLTNIPQCKLHKLYSIHTLIYFSCHAIFTFDPAHTQRFYMSASVQQASKMFSKNAIIRIVMALFFLIAIAALYMGGHEIHAGERVLHYILNLNYLPGIQGLLMTTIIALLMSTASSYLHTGSILFANDLWPFLVKSIQKIHISTVKVARIASVILGIGAVLIALYTNHIIVRARGFYTPAVTVPMMVACFGFRPRTIVVLFTMGINILITFYYVFIKGGKITVQVLLESIIYTTLLLFVTHFLFPKEPGRGWVGIPDDSPIKLKNQETKRWWIMKIQYLQSIFTQSYWANIFPKSASTFRLIGVYLILYTTVCLFYMQKAYRFFYIYCYISVMVIGTLIAFYPILHNYRKRGISLLYMLWPIVLCVVLFIFGITFIKLSHFSPMSLALFIINIGISSLVLPCIIIIAMLSVALLIHRCIPLHIAIVDCKEWITTETIIGLTILLNCLVYRYIRNKANRKLEIIALARSYEQNYTLTSLHNQANWNRLDPTYSGKVLRDMADVLEPYVQELPIQQHQKKLYLFSESLLKRAKEERTFTLDPKSIKKVNIEDLILKSYENVKQLDIPIQLLLNKKNKEKYLLTQATVFERLLTINFWNLCQSKYAMDYAISFTISDTFLSYPFRQSYQEPIGSDYEKQLMPPILSALAFCISTDTDRMNILPTYEVTDEVSSGYLPKTINNLYQEESRQTVEAHGGYTQIIETETSLACLYILPTNGRNVMRFKRYHTDDLSNQVAETAESLAQERELIGLLVSKTTLTKKVVKQTIHFIKKAHGVAKRRSGEPYYTHPMEVAKIVLEVTKDAKTILAALLHDVVEDTMVTLEQIELQYGIEVAYIVDMLTHYNTYGYRWKLDNSDNQVILNQCKDIRVVQIKLADRLHNLRTIAVRKREDQTRIAKETMEFYIPWAKKNNILKWLSEMENICKQVF